MHPSVMPPSNQLHRTVANVTQLLAIIEKKTTWPGAQLTHSLVQVRDSWVYLGQCLPLLETLLAEYRASVELCSLASTSVRRTLAAEVLPQGDLPSMTTIERLSLETPKLVKSYRCVRTIQGHPYQRRVGKIRVLEVELARLSALVNYTERRGVINLLDFLAEDQMIVAPEGRALTSVDHRRLDRWSRWVIVLAAFEQASVQKPGGEPLTLNVFTWKEKVYQFTIRTIWDRHKADMANLEAGIRTYILEHLNTACQFVSISGRFGKEVEQIKYLIHTSTVEKLEAIRDRLDQRFEDVGHKGYNEQDIREIFFAPFNK